MRSLKIFYIVGFSLLAIYLIAEFNKPKEINWQNTLAYQDKIPYGTYILYHEIHQLFDSTQVVGTNTTFYDKFHDSTAAKSNYLIIANSITLSKFDYREMVKYMQAGNSIFIASGGYPQEGLKRNLLADTLKFELSEPKPFGNKGENLNFTNSKLKHSGGYHFDRGIANQYFESFDTARAVVLCKNQAGQPTLLRYSFGKGNMFICASPQVFTNYSLLRDAGADYATKALSYLPVRPVLYWDHHQNGDVVADESPVRVFFGNPSLEWAYYLALFSMVGFVLFEMKRRQRIIPIIEPLANSTVDFVNVVGRVYYEQRNNTNIAQKKILYFLEHLRTTYYLKTNKLDKEFIEKLSNKTGVDYAFAEELVTHILYITDQRVSDHDLIKLNQLIEQFYIKSR